MDTVIIDGVEYGTGLQIPLTLDACVPELSDSQFPIHTVDECKSIIAGKDFRGSTRFDSAWIMNQRNHGSCQGFMSAGMLSRAFVRRGMRRTESGQLLPLDRILLSGAYIYSWCNGGRDSGSTLDDGMAIVTNRGSCLQTTVPWNKIYPSQYDVEKANAEAAQNKAFECYALRDEAQLFTACILGFDVGIAVHADSGFNRLDGNAIAGGGNGPGNHAVGVDGCWLQGDTLVADMYNSWATSYGRQGRAGVTWQQHLRHTYRYHPFYAIRSSLDGSGEMNPPAPQV